jgi:hypothetical protein
MAEKEPEKRQQVTPTGHKIPIPTRKDVMRDLTKVAKSKPSTGSGGGGSGSGGGNVGDGGGSEKR